MESYVEVVVFNSCRMVSQDKIAADNMPDEKPPVLKTWNTIYFMVLGFLVLLIIALYFFTIYFK